MPRILQIEDTRSSARTSRSVRGLGVDLIRSAVVVGVDLASGTAVVEPSGRRGAPTVGEEAGRRPGSGEERRRSARSAAVVERRRSERKQGGGLAAAPRGRCRGTDEPPPARVSRDGIGIG
jgi:hypothetical protein